ncbi:hypothetical protein BDW_07910 [Bdellovibrio bacteriovorus W]|nr:hypothetical protein BDW_07910 [Bdellovibrio bacteriovorus W]
MSSKSIALLTSLMTTALMGCTDKLAFSGIQMDEAQLSIPSVELPQVPKGEYTKRSGICAQTGTSLTSCLSCASEAAKPAAPVMSQKAQALVEIMAAGCAVPNKSDPAGYRAPSKNEILARVIQCSESAYPTTALSGSQAQTVAALLSNPAAQELAFGKLYYNAASTDFETYFGLEIKEARDIFCRGQAGLGSHGVYPKEYYDSLYSGAYYKLPQAFVAAQGYRSDLRTCLEQSRLNPHVNQPQPTPGKVCQYTVVDGDISNELLLQVSGMQENGNVYYEGSGQCGQVRDVTDFYDITGPHRFVQVQCQ